MADLNTQMAMPWLVIFRHWDRVTGSAY